MMTSFYGNCILTPVYNLGRYNSYNVNYISGYFKHLRYLVNLILYDHTKKDFQKKNYYMKVCWLSFGDSVGLFTKPGTEDYEYWWLFKTIAFHYNV